MPTSATPRKPRSTKKPYKNTITKPKKASKPKKRTPRPEQKRKTSNNYGVTRRTFGV